MILLYIYLAVFVLTLLMFSLWVIGTSQEFKRRYPNTKVLSIQIPVDKEYFDSVNVGDVIDDRFRMGSLIFKGSFGSWDITVEDKQIL